MSVSVIKKNLLSRLASFILLLPFVPAARPLISRNNSAELIIFISGFLLTLILIVISNNKPYIKLTEKNLFVYLLYRHKPEIHNFSSMEKALLRTPGRLEIHSSGFDPLDIRLRKKEMENLIERLEKEGVEISKAYRSS